MAYITVKNVVYRYPLASKDSLNDISFSLEKGDFLAVMGKNASGKTSLCQALRRFIPDYHKGRFSGEIIVDDNSLSDLSKLELAQKIGFVFQNPYMQLSGVKKTVFEEIAFGLENLGLDRQLILKKVRDILSFLKINDLQEKNPSALSGGQLQKVILACILVMDTDIIILDEPTSQLDPVASKEVFEILKKIVASGKTIILAEHKIELIACYANKGLVMDKGRMISFGPISTVLSNKRLLDKDIAMNHYAHIAHQLNLHDSHLFSTIPTTKERFIEIYESH